MEFDDNVKTSHANSINKVVEHNLKHIIEENLDNATNSIKMTLENIRKEFDELSLELNF